MIEVNYNDYKRILEENMRLIPENHKLKEEVERLNKERNKTYENGLNYFLELQQKKEEVERLNNRLKTSNDTCNYLKNTIDKAIEYIDRRDIEWGSEEHNILLSILKGSDIE